MAKGRKKKLERRKARAAAKGQTTETQNSSSKSKSPKQNENYTNGSDEYYENMEHFDGDDEIIHDMMGNENGDGREEEGCTCDHIRFVKPKDVQNRISSPLLRNVPLVCEVCSPPNPPKKGKKGRKAQVTKGPPQKHYICLTCAHLGCPRDKKQHALDHHEAKKSTRRKCPIAMDISTLRSWCFVCDKWLDECNIDYDDYNYGRAIKECEQYIKRHLEKTTAKQNQKELPDAPSASSNRRKKQQKQDEIMAMSAPPEPGITGLQNLGNTCFFNSVMQNICETRPLKKFFLNIPKQEDGQLQGALRGFLDTMWATQKRSFKPSSMLSAIKKQNRMFIGGQQHDSHELLRTLINGVRDEKVELRKEKRRQEAYDVVINWTRADIEEWLENYAKLDLTIYRENVEFDEKYALDGKRLFDVLKAKTKKNKKNKKNKMLDSFGFNKDQKSRFLQELVAVRRLKSKFLQDKIAEARMKKKKLKEAEETKGERGDDVDDDDDEKVRQDEEEEDKFDADLPPQLKKDSLVDNVFGGLLQSSVTCLECNTKSVTVEPFYDISVPIAPDESQVINQRLQPKGAWKKRAAKNKNKNRYDIDMSDLENGFQPAMSKKKMRNMKKNQKKNKRNKRNKKINLQNIDELDAIERAKQASLKEEAERKAKLKKEKEEQEAKEKEELESKEKTGQEVKENATPEENGAHEATASIEKPQEDVAGPQKASSPEINGATNVEPNDDSLPPLEKLADTQNGIIQNGDNLLNGNSPKGDLPNGDVSKSLSDLPSLEKAGESDLPELEKRFGEMGISSERNGDDLSPPKEVIEDRESEQLAEQLAKTLNIDQITSPSKESDKASEQGDDVSQSSPSSSKKGKDADETAESPTKEDEDLEKRGDDADSVDTSSTSKSSTSKNTSKESSSKKKKPKRRVRKGPLGTARLTGATDLRECLFAFTDPEILSGVNAYGCQNCTDKKMKEITQTNGAESADDEREEDSDSSVEKQPVLVKCDAEKRYLIKATPKILTVHLKRFTHGGRGNLRKCGKNVKFPTTLDISDFCVSPQKTQSTLNTSSETSDKEIKSEELPTLANGENSGENSSEKETSGQHSKSSGENVIGSCKYKLYGVVVHSGGMYGGHYISYVNKKRDKTPGGRWFYFSDSSSREVSLKVVESAEAYILFYERIKG